MYFGVTPSAYRSIHVAPIFRSFELSPWHVAAWKWLLEKHPIVWQEFFAIGYRSRPKEPAIDSPQPFWADLSICIYIYIYIYIHQVYKLKSAVRS